MIFTLTTLAHFAILLGVVLRILLRRHREPASRVAWLAVVSALPFLGVLIYLLVGEVNIGRRLSRRNRALLGAMAEESQFPCVKELKNEANLPDRYLPLFRVGYSVSHFEPTVGNRAWLMADSNAAVDSIVTDMDAASQTIDVLFYIWLTDHNGRKVVDALVRAAKRGVRCRVMVDGLGSRGMIGSGCWREMQEAAVHLEVALPVGNPILRMVTGRIDLRNHRKIVVIDERLTYCGSQNCADPEFLVKARYAPWVDVMVRLEGPIAEQNGRLFESDWQTYSTKPGELKGTVEPSAAVGDVVAQVIATGPTHRASAMPEVFESLMFLARRELIITTPYFVPNESLLDAICSAAYRGVKTTLVLPARNDSWVVAAASRSNYLDLLEAGVLLYEYAGGLLHAKTLTVDGEMTLIGSANMDRRSFDLNFENNILLYSASLTQEVKGRQSVYLADARMVSLAEVEAWPLSRRLWNNSLATLGPIL